MQEANYKKSTYIEIALYLFIIAFSIAFPLFVGLAFSGFSESFVKGQALEFGTYLANFLTYIPFLIVGILCIIFPITKLITLKPNQHPATTPNPKWYRIFSVSYIHAPEENGLLWQLSKDAGKSDENNTFRWLKNPLIVLIISIIVFGLYGLFLIGNPQIAVSGVKQLQLQQVTLASEVTFNALVPAMAENMLLLFFFMLFMGINAYILSKLKNKNIYAFYGVGIVVIILSSIIWMFFHLLAYGSSEISLIISFVFAFIGLLITMLTGSFLPFFIFHLMNNTFITLSRYITLKEDLLLISILIWVLITAMTIGIWWYKKKKKKIVYGIPAS